jgi:hypothetical protein
MTQLRNFHLSFAQSRLSVHRMNEHFVKFTLNIRRVYVGSLNEVRNNPSALTA